TRQIVYWQVSQERAPAPEDSWNQKFICCNGTKARITARSRPTARPDVRVPPHLSNRGKHAPSTPGLVRWPVHSASQNRLVPSSGVGLCGCGMAAGMPDHYATLGLQASCTAREVTVRYRELARALHPDKQTSAPEDERNSKADMMASIAAAYAVLGDASARATYDAAVAAAQARASTADQGGAAATVDLDDMQWDGVRREYFSACRCGGRYAVQEAGLGAGGS
ncbi:DPH4, partial [Symbiodinium sp. KB8]